MRDGERKFFSRRCARNHARTESFANFDRRQPDPAGRPIEEVRATREEIERRVRELVAEMDRGEIHHTGGDGGAKPSHADG